MVQTGCSLTSHRFEADFKAILTPAAQRICLLHGGAPPAVSASLPAAPLVL